jgi:hypothetical protein
LIERKIRDIQEHFASVMGETILRYETAELLLEDGTWASWPDPPIRLYAGSGRLVAISWSRFDDLWLADNPVPPLPDREFDDQMGHQRPRKDQPGRRGVDQGGDARAGRNVGRREGV